MSILQLLQKRNHSRIELCMMMTPGQSRIFQPHKDCMNQSCFQLKNFRGHTEYSFRPLYSCIHREDNRTWENRKFYQVQEWPNLPSTIYR